MTIETSSTAATIRRYRIAAGLSQEALAARVGLGRVTIARHESGTRAPNVSSLRRYAAVLGVDMDELINAAPAGAPRPPPSGAPRVNSSTNGRSRDALRRAVERRKVGLRRAQEKARRAEERLAELPGHLVTSARGAQLVERHTRAAVEWQEAILALRAAEEELASADPGAAP